MSFWQSEPGLFEEDAGDGLLESVQTSWVVKSAERSFERAVTVEACYW